MDLDQVLRFLLLLALVSIAFFLCGVVVGQSWSFSGSYLVRILICALLTVLVVPFLQDLGRSFGLEELGLLVGFVVLVIVVRFVMVEELTVSDDWLAALVISLLVCALIYVVPEAIDRVERGFNAIWV